jgi:hypothetical protein
MRHGQADAGAPKAAGAGPEERGAQASADALLAQLRAGQPPSPFCGPPAAAAVEPEVGFGRVAVSEADAPNILANLV